MGAETKQTQLPTQESPPQNWEEARANYIKQLAKLPPIRVLVFQENSMWAAVAVDYFLSTQSNTLPSVLRDFEKALQTELLLSTAEPLQPRSSDGYKQRFENAEATAKPLTPPTPELPSLRDLIDARVA